MSCRGSLLIRTRPHYRPTTLMTNLQGPVSVCQPRESYPGIVRLRNVEGPLNRWQIKVAGCTAMERRQSICDVKCAMDYFLLDMSIPHTQNTF